MRAPAATCRASLLAALGMGRGADAAADCPRLPLFAGPALMRVAGLAGLVGAGLAAFAVLALALGDRRLARAYGDDCAGNRLDPAPTSAITRAMNRIFSGVQPTGNLHLGNYLGAIRNWVALQNDYECIFCIVDLHALTLPQDPAELRASTREVTAAYIAAGIDPERCIIFNQSMVSAHAELAWLLACLTPLGWLNRMTQFKEKAGKQREMAGLGLYAYPVLMAADILVYKATHVPVGEDQKQHLELPRDIAGAFNRRYERDFFPLPEPQIFGTATRVMSLRDGTKKMSKSDTSDYSRINMTDDAEYDRVQDPPRQDRPRAAAGDDRRSRAPARGRQSDRHLRSARRRVAG